MIETAYAILFGAAFIVLGLCVLALIVRSIKGPGVPVRVICVNVIGSMVTSIFAMLAAYFHEGWLFDVCIVYVLISFLAVVVLAKVYMFRAEKKESEPPKDDGGSADGG